MQTQRYLGANKRPFRYCFQDLVLVEDLQSSFLASRYLRLQR